MYVRKKENELSRVTDKMDSVTAADAIIIYMEILASIWQHIVSDWLLAN